MLKKLFKYDFKNCTKYMIPVLIVIATSCLLVVTLGGVFAVMVPADESTMEEPTLITITRMFLAMMSVFGIYLFAAIPLFAAMVMEYLCMKNFYDDTFTDRAYLRLTLPVGTGKLLMSKLLSSTVCLAIVTACILLLLPASIAGAIFLASAKFLPEGINLFAEAANSLKTLFETMPFNIPDLIFTVFLTILNLLAGHVFSMLSFYFLSLLGYKTAKKHKLLGVIGFYIGGSYLLSIVLSTVSSVLYVPYMFMTSDLMASKTVLVFPSLLPTLLLMIGLDVLFWFLSKHLLDKKHDLV